MRILLTIIMLPLIGYGAVKGYLWYDFKGKVDETVKQVSAFADVTYGAIYTDLRGEVGVDDLVVKPKMAPNDIFELKTLRFTMPNIMYFLDTSKKLEQGGIPETMAVTVEDLRVDLGGELLASMSQMQRQMAMLQAQSGQAPVAGSENSFDALGCGNVSAIGLEELKRMGYGVVVTDFRMKFDYDEADSSFSIDINGKTDEMYGFDINTSFTADPAMVRAPMMAASGMGSKPQFRRMRLDYSDLGYNERRNRFCAAQGSEAVEAFVDRHIELLASELGASFTKEVVDSYRDFMLKPGGTMQLVMYPSTATDFSGLGLYTPEQLVKMLGIQVTINQHPVQPNEIEWVAGGPVTKVEEVVEQPVVEPMAYREVAMAELKNFIGRAAKVHTKDGRMHEGRLARADSTGVAIEKRMQGGVLSIPLANDKVERVEVFY